jgi:hypothetical protein
MKLSLLISCNNIMKNENGILFKWHSDDTKFDGDWSENVKINLWVKTIVFLYYTITQRVPDESVLLLVIRVMNNF